MPKSVARMNTALGSIPLVGIDPSMADVFGRLKTTRHQAMFDTDLEYGLQSTRWESITGNSGTIAHMPEKGGVNLSVPANTANSYAIRQTKRYFRYQSGKQQYTSAAALFSFPDSGVINRVGMFDDCNGLFFEQNYADVNTTVTSAGNQVNPNGISVVRRATIGSSVTDTKFTKDQWNVDPMDGTGPSRINLDFNKLQMFSIQFAWYGAGIATFGFYIDGRFYPVHVYKHANNVTQAYMRTGNLPARYEIRTNSSGTNAASNLYHYGTSVMTEGGFDVDRGYIYAGSNGVTSKASITTTRTPLTSVRVRQIATSVLTGQAVSGATSNSATVTGAAWTVNAYAGLFCVITSGTNIGKIYLIASNTANTLTFDTTQILYPVTTPVPSSDVFSVGLLNRGGILPTDIDVYTAGAPAFIEVLLNPTLTGASFTDIGGTSLSQKDTAATAISATGEVVASYYATAGSVTRVDLTGLYPLGLNTKGLTADILTVAVTAVGGGTITAANATIRFSEAQS